MRVIEDYYLGMDWLPKLQFFSIYVARNYSDVQGAQPLVCFQQILDYLWAEKMTIIVKPEKILGMAFKFRKVLDKPHKYLACRIA